MNKLQEVIINKMKEHYGKDFYVPEFTSEEEVRQFIQKNDSDILYGGDKYISGLFIDYKTLILSDEDELFNEEQLSIEFNWECGLMDVFVFDVSYIKYCRLNNLTVPQNILKEYEKELEEKEREQEEEEKWLEDITYPSTYYDTYSPGDDFETDWFNSLE